MAIKDLDQLKSEGKKLGVISHPLRLSILEYIKENEPVFVSQIYKDLDLEQSVTSSQLGYLRKADFLKTKRDGKKVYYSLNRKGIGAVLEDVKAYFVEH